MPDATPATAPRRAKPPRRIIKRRASEPSGHVTTALLQILRPNLDLAFSDARNIRSSPSSDPAASFTLASVTKKMEIQQQSGSTPAHVPTPEQREIDRVLYLRRISQARSCYPCRQRKVKCDHGQPCRTCQKRGHPEICSYNVGTPEKRRGRRAKKAVADGTMATTVSQGVSASIPTNRIISEQHGKELPSREDSLESETSSNRTSPAATVKATELASTVAAAACSRAPQANCYRTIRKEHYQGDSSVLAMLHGSADSPAVEMRRKAGPVLGLHNTLEFYPFMKLKTIQERWAELLKLIPQKQEVLRCVVFSVSF